MALRLTFPTSSQTHFGGLNRYWTSYRSTSALMAEVTLVARSSFVAVAIRPYQVLAAGGQPPEGVPGAQ
jgi:hypothetical protein